MLLNSIGFMLWDQCSLSTSRVESFLVRADDDKNKNFVFNDLHNIADSRVAVLMAVRQNLPEESSALIRMAFSSKSLRCGGTQLMSDPLMGFVLAAARSGHSIGSNLQKYVENIGIAMSLPGGMVLNGCRNVTIESRPKPYGFGALPEVNRELYIPKNPRGTPSDESCLLPTRRPITPCSENEGCNSDC